jgi:phospholipid/cholesterol/gamma-HCH transport system substrate-binding protein
MRRRRPTAWVCVLLVGGLLSGGCAGGGGGGYGVSFVFPEASGLLKGSSVQMSGINVGKVTGLAVENGQALVRVSLNRKYTPLREGTTARIAYRGFVDVERFLEVRPAPKEAAPIPTGGVVKGNVERVELDEVVNSLDPDTRAAIRRLLPNLDETLSGQEAAVSDTLKEAAPAVEALSEVLGAVGEDGPALRRLITSARELVQRLNGKREGLRTSLGGLESSLGAVADQQEAVQGTLQKLPPALRQANAALGKVPAAVGAAVPLLTDLRPAVEALPGVADELRPLVGDLRPTVSELEPLVSSLADVLVDTPPLLDRAHATLPPLGSTTTGLLPVVDFLRPYTPELAGLLTNLGAMTASYDEYGHYLRGYVQGNSGFPGSSSEKMSPFLRQEPKRAPGHLEGRRGPLTDAAGSGVR